MQVENICSRRNRDVGNPRLRCIIGTDRQNLNRVGCRRRAGRCIRSISVNRSADACASASRTLHLPHHALIARSQNRSCESLYAEWRKRHARGLYGHHHLIDDRDLCSRALRCIRHAHCRGRHRIRRGNRPGRKKIHVQRTCACDRLARIRTRHANLAHSRIASRNSIYVPIHASIGSSVDLRR